MVQCSCIMVEKLTQCNGIMKYMARAGHKRGNQRAATHYHAQHDPEACHSLFDHDHTMHTCHTYTLPRPRWRPQACFVNSTVLSQLYNIHDFKVNVIS